MKDYFTQLHQSIDLAPLCQMVTDGNVSVACVFVVL